MTYGVCCVGNQINLTGRFVLFILFRSFIHLHLVLYQFVVHCGRLHFWEHFYVRVKMR